MKKPELKIGETENGNDRMTMESKMMTKVVFIGIKTCPYGGLLGALGSFFCPFFLPGA